MTAADFEARVERVTGLDDERLADYRALREADLASRRGAFIAESEVVLRVLLTVGRFRVRSVFMTRSRLRKLAPLLVDSRLRAPVYLGEQALLDQVVGFHIHRGVLAACQRQPIPTPAALLATLPPGVLSVLVLEGLTNHDNVGGAFRNAAAFGAAAVLYDVRTCDPLYRKAIRVSVGAALLVPFARAASTAESVTALRAHGFAIIATTPRGDAEDITRCALLRHPPERLAVLVGSEGPGLTDETLAAADAQVRIDIAPGFDSLNVATASGVALHAVRTARQRAR